MKQVLLTIAVCALHLESTIAISHAESANTPPAGKNAPEITVHKSRHFRLHTDLPADQAAATLERMESAMRLAAEYWQRKTRGRIECYVAENVTHWPEDALPHPLARVWIGAIGGATIRQPLPQGPTPARHVAIYASARPGVVEHEVIHAYCCQAFGATGPDWYKEGMAQFVSYSMGEKSGMQCPPEVLEALQDGETRSIDQIVRSGSFTRTAVESLDQLLSERNDQNRSLLMADWTNAADDEIANLREPYFWSWALCHFLASNPNYAGRFRRLGERYLLQDAAAADALLGPISKQASFEFSQFVNNACPGYSADLCRWEWEKPFRCLDVNATMTRKVRAARGFQPSGLCVRGGETIAYRATGRWVTAPDSDPTTADGNRDGRGRLVAALLHDYQLSDPIELGSDGKFVAPGPGCLYVRCDAPWNKLDENSGSVTVRFGRVDE